jgi:hypothetical protein
MPHMSTQVLVVNFTPATPPEVVVEHLRPVLADVHAALCAAIPKARAFFDAEGAPIERNLFAAQVRFHVKRTLLATLDIEEEPGPDGYDMEALAFIGLSINLPGFAIRILKSPDRQVPTSQSSSRLRFYQQHLYAPEAPGDSGPLHLVLLWDTDYLSSVSLQLACPKGQTKKVECHWNEPLDGFKSAAVSVAPFQLEESDLEIKLKRKEQPKEDATPTAEEAAADDSGADEEDDDQ